MDEDRGGRRAEEGEEEGVVEIQRKNQEFFGDGHTTHLEVLWLMSSTDASGAFPSSAGTS